MDRASLRALLVVFSVAAVLLHGCGEDPSPSPPPGVPVTHEPLSFASAAASGTMRLNGTLFLPASSDGKLPGVLLISGSGPNNRYESVSEGFFSTQILNPSPYQGSFCFNRGMQFEPFYEIAMHLAAQGYAVFTYDKRTCMDPAKGCYKNICTMPGQTGCLNITSLTFQDFIDDATHALLALGAHAKVDGSDLTVIGHSQGCTIAPYVAATSPDTSKVVLLMGAGSPITGTFYRQMNNIEKKSRSIMNESFCDPSVTWQKQILDNAIASLELVGKTKPVVGPIFDQWHAGINPFPPKEVISLGFFGSGPSQFFFQWVQDSMPEKYSGVIKQFLGTPGHTLLAINSNTDLNVSPEDYLPLRAILEKFSQAKHVTIPDLTHLLSPASLTSANVTSEVFTTLLSFLKDSGANSDAII